MHLIILFFYLFIYLFVFRTSLELKCIPQPTCFRKVLIVLLDGSLTDFWFPCQHKFECVYFVPFILQNKWIIYNYTPLLINRCKFCPSNILPNARNDISAYLCNCTIWPESLTTDFDLKLLMFSSAIFNQGQTDIFVKTFFAS
jgi:hypothetical protein